MVEQLLTAAQVIGITGDESPLTPADVRAAVARFYASQDRVALALSDAGWRPTTWGNCGNGMTCMTDSRGIWALMWGTPDRAGHIAWRDAERVLAEATAGEQLGLFTPDPPEVTP